MPSVQFGQNTCYVIQSPNIAARFRKRLELMDRHLNNGMSMCAEGNKTYLCFSNAANDPELSVEQIEAEAKKAGNVINLEG